MKSKTIITELVILIVVFILTWLIAFWLTGAHHILKPALDIGLHDTYLVLPWKTIIVQPFLILTTLIYCIKEAFYTYKRRFQNMVLLTCIFLINVILFFDINFAHNIASQIGDDKGKWAIYPPLSALPNLRPPSPPVDYLFQILLIVQIFLLVLMVIIAVITGKNWNINKREN